MDTNIVPEWSCFLTLMLKKVERESYSNVLVDYVWVGATTDIRKSFADKIFRQPVFILKTGGPHLLFSAQKRIYSSRPDSF